MLRTDSVPFMPVTPFSESVCRFVSEPMLAGSGPLRPEPLRSSDRSVVKLPMQEGIVPVSVLIEFSCNVCRTGALQIELFMPFQLLLLRLRDCNAVSAAKFPPMMPLNRLPERVAVFNLLRVKKEVGRP